MLRRLVSSLSGAAARPAETGARRQGQLFLIGYRNFMFNMFAPQIANAVQGGISGVISDEAVNAGMVVTMAGRTVPFVSFDDFLAYAKDRDVVVAHFFDDLDQYWPLRELRRLPRIAILDFLELLHALDLPHTYVPVREERRYALDADSDYAAVRERLTDARSHATLAARIDTLRRLDRRALLEARFPSSCEYYGDGSPDGCLQIRPDEIYVDVGAANGDTVDRFCAVAHGRFAAIHAFEPTPGQFRELQLRADADPRIRAYRNAVGDSAGSLRFHDNAQNPFGSNAFIDDPQHAIEVECVRLDDVIDRCTLIKMDVEGYECNVLRGATRLIAQCRPNMAITCYHYPQDLAQISALVAQIHPYRHVALRHYGPSLYDSVLLFSDTQRFDA